MIGKAFAAIWGIVRAAFTLKGMLIMSVVGLLVVAMVFAMPQRLREPRYRPPAESTGTAGSESTASPRIAIVIVGLGGESRGLDPLIARLLGMGVPLTWGVAPASSNSKRQAQLVTASQSEVALNLPVVFSQGRNFSAPGQVKYDMRRRQVGRQIVTDIFSIGSIAGIATRGGYAPGKTDGPMMRVVMAMAKRRNVYLLDLASNSEARRLAGEIDLQYFAPDVILDQPATADHVRKQVSIAINRAVSSKGKIVVLGHLLPATVNVLEDLMGKIKDAKIELTTLSNLNVSAEETVTPSLVPTSTGEESPTAPTATVPPQGTEVPGGAKAY